MEAPARKEVDFPVEPLPAKLMTNVSVSFEKFNKGAARDTNIAVADAWECTANFPTWFFQESRLPEVAFSSVFISLCKNTGIVVGLSVISLFPSRYTCLPAAFFQPVVLQSCPSVSLRFFCEELHKYIGLRLLKF